jgi:hypothetical protein
MELVVPLVMGETALALMIVGLILHYIVDAVDAAIICLLFSTIFFFVSGACFLGVTETTSFPVYNSTGAITSIHTVVRSVDYKWAVYLGIVLGFIPILLLYELGFRKDEK